MEWAGVAEGRARRGGMVVVERVYERPLDSWLEVSYKGGKAEAEYCVYGCYNSMEAGQGRTYC